MRTAICCCVLTGLALTAHAQPVVLSTAQVRVEARIENGRVQERYLARTHSGWVEIARAAGASNGTITLRQEGGELLRARAESASLEQGKLVERFSAGGARIVRTISADTRSAWLHVSTRLEPAGELALHSFTDEFRFASAPDWSYSPSIGGVNPDAQYKAPLVLTQAGPLAFGIVPDVTILDRPTLKRCNHSTVLDVPAGPRLATGFLPVRQAFHTVFVPHEDRGWRADGQIRNDYYLFLTAQAPPGQAYREPVRFHWERFGRTAQSSAAAQQASTDPAYRELGLWEDWRKHVWEKESPKQWLSMPLDGAAAGAVRTLRWGGPSPSVYLSAWFNSMRTAYGMALYARRTGNAESLALAGQTVHPAVHAPGVAGAFKCVVVPGGQATRWAAGDGIGGSLKNGYLGFDMSWTAYWLLRWRDAKLPGSEDILPRCRRLADLLVRSQQPDGMLPSRFDESGEALLADSRQVFAETAPEAMFLFELARQTGDKRYLQAALRALEFLNKQVIPQRKWYDFETFFSCSPRVAALDEKTGQWPANNLALIHAPAAFLAAWRATGRTEYLERGTALLDYLLLTQQCWTNPALEELPGPNALLGGFTTQNSDAEWSDARQSLAANVLSDYYRATNDVEYLERGVAALRAQFPISPSENWAHTGYGKKAGVSSFHWGTGSGMAGVEIEEDYLRDVIADIADMRAARAVGVNGIDVTKCTFSGDRIELELTSPFQWSRKPVGTFRGTDPAKRYMLFVGGHSAGTFTGKELERGVELPRR